ncbi:T9SS type A sorting domain-containing protein [bacterium]
MSGCYLSTTGGSAWTEIDDGMDDGYALAFGSFYQGGRASDGSNTVMAVFKSTNDGGSWSRYYLTTEPGEVYSIAVHPANTDIVYAGGRYVAGSTYSAGLFKTTDGGAIWVDIGSSMPAYQIYSVCIDPYDYDRIYAGTSRYVYISADGGINWTESDLDANIQSIICDPTTPSRLFAGTLSGVYESLNGGATWSPINTGLNCLLVQCMDFDPINGILYAGTRGGIYRYFAGTPIQDDNSNTDVPEQITLHQNYPNPFNMQTEIVYELPVDGPVHLAIYNVQGRRIRTLVYKHLSAGRKSVSWDGRDMEGKEVSSGMYIYRLKTENYVDMKKMILQK